MAEHELEMLRNRKGYLRRLEQDRDELLAFLVESAPEALEALVPEDRQQLYKILRLTAVVKPDGSMEISGAFGSHLGVRDLDTTLGCNSQNTTQLELRFQAILDDGVCDVRFERVTSKTEAGNRWRASLCRCQ